MTLGMKLDKTLCWIALGVAGLLGLIFLLDLATKLIFNRFSVGAEVCMVVACAVVVWQGIETMREL